MPITEIFNFPYLKYFLWAYLVFTLLYLLVYFLRKKGKIEWINLLLGIGIITLGITTGIIMSNNRSPISDTIMASILSLLGGMLTFMFFKKEDLEEGKEKKIQAFMKKNKLTVLFFLIFFPLSLLYGAHTGSRYRILNEEEERIIEHNSKISLDSTNIWVKEQEMLIEISKLKALTWSENEKKRFDYLLNHRKEKDSIPEAPVY